MLNGDLAAVIVHEGFSFRSRHEAPFLRTILESGKPRATFRRRRSTSPSASSGFGPGLDLYFVSNGRVEDVFEDDQGESSGGASSTPSRKFLSFTSPCSKAFRTVIGRPSSTI